MFTRRTALMGAAFVAAAPFVVKTAGAQESAANAGAAPVDLSTLTRRKVKLVAPPFVHAHDQVATSGPKIVEFEMKIVEKEIQVDEDAWLQAFTYNGSVPGPMMVVHEGDYVELTLFNPPENMLQHNIDFHAATGALGGGALTLVNPGEKAVLRFKATRPGVFVYHCAPGGPMIPWHVVSGMSGCIMVLPREGLKDHAKDKGDAGPDEYYQLNLAFHEAVAIAAGNPYLTEMIKTNARKLLAYYRARYRYAGSIAASAREHRHILTLITARDSVGAEAAMQAHVQFDQITAMDLIAALS